MKYVAAYLLANLGGNKGSKAEIKKIIESVGGTVDETALDAFLKAVDGKSAEEWVKEGTEKLASVPAAGPATAAAPAAASGGAAAAKAPEPEPEEEEEEEEADFDLFD